MMNMETRNKRSPVKRHHLKINNPCSYNKRKIRKKQKLKKTIFYQTI